MKFIIDRKKWFRGSVEHKGQQLDSALYVPEVKQYCCLGLIAKQMKVKDEYLRDIGTPEAVLSTRILSLKYRKIFLEDDEVNSQLAEAAMTINDDDKISEKMREYKLKNLFKKHGHEIEFVN